MSASSSHTLQTLSNSESMSMPMPNGQQPLASDTDLISWAEEDLTKLVAALRGEESSPEVLAQLYELLDTSEEELLEAYEYAMARPANAQADKANNDETPVPQQGSSTAVEHVGNAQASFPTLEILCQLLSDSRERAMQAGHDFYPEEGIKSVYGHIVPTKDAT
ncbi:hypothetical protein P692DRAFT_20873502 [Suillus brevipes Sb2]|nr:hypothetical protein P692DRAFT_20873502 [Suillus brevipes Sb2]